MSTYQERLADARILFPAATSPDDPRVVAAAEQRLRILGYDDSFDSLWLGSPGPAASTDYSALTSGSRIPAYDRL